MQYVNILFNDRYFLDCVIRIIIRWVAPNHVLFFVSKMTPFFIVGLVPEVNLLFYHSLKTCMERHL